MIAAKSYSVLRFGIQGLMPAAFTLVIFVALALSNLVHRSEQPITLFKIETASVPHAQPLAPPQNTAQARERELPSFRPDAPPPLMPVQAALSLDPMPSSVSGDFALEFGLLDPTLVSHPQDYVFDIADMDTHPQPISQADPIYPTRARLQSIEGEVRLEFIVDRQGEVQTLRILTSTPHGVFDEAALRAVRRWRFQPGIRNGEAFPVRVYQTLKFTLEL